MSHHASSGVSRFLKSCLFRSVLVIPVVINIASIAESATHAELSYRAKSFEPAQLRRMDVTDDEWREAVLDCGVRCVALALEIAEIPVDIGAVRNRVPIGSHGSSMADMHRALCDLGFPMKGVRCQPASVAQLPVPAIGQVEPTHRSNIGHFVVLLAVTDDHVVVCDPSTDQIQDIPIANFGRYTTGYYLIPTPASWARLLWEGAALVGGFGIGLWTHRGGLRSRKIATLATLVPVLTCIGCQSKSEALPERQSLVRFDSELALLGKVAPNQIVTHRFQVKNLSDRELRVKVVQPSCDCLGSSIIPSPKLAPNGKAEVEMKIAVGERDPGSITASAVFLVEEFNEKHNLVIDALVEGLVARNGVYTVRPTHSLEKLPPLELLVYTSVKDAQFRLISVLSDNGLFTADVGQADIGSSRVLVPSGYERRIRVPLKLASGSTAEAQQSKFVVVYELGHERRTKMIEANILAR